MKAKFFILLALLVAIVPAAAAQEPVTITFWHTYSEQSPENTTLVDVLIPVFEAANPGINVESVPYPYDGFRQALLTSAAGGAGPDLIRLDIIWSPEFAELGVLKNLSTDMPDFEEYAAAVFPGPLSTNLYNGEYYGLPLDTNTRAFVYNPALLAEVGLELPTTMEEFSASCDAITALGEEHYLFSDGGTSGWNLLPWIWSFGGGVTDPEITTATGYVNGENTVAAIQFIKDHMDSGCISDGFIGSGIDNWGGYFTGTIATMLEGPWLNSTAAAQFPDFEVGTALFPAGEAGSISVVGGENIVISATSANQEAALEFLRFTQSEEYQLTMTTVGQITVLNNLLEHEYFQTHPYYGVFLEQLQDAKARTPHPKYTQIENVLSEAVQFALRGEIEIQEALDYAAEEINALLAE